MLIGIVGAALFGLGAVDRRGALDQAGSGRAEVRGPLARGRGRGSRRYAPTIVAVTIVEGEREAALNEGFRRLAGYIFGKNRKKETIAMTAPVSATRSEKIAMTAPVSATTTGDGAYRVTFTMPPGSTLETLPDPDDERVTLEAVPGRDLAAVRFSGWATTAAIEEHRRAARLGEARGPRGRRRPDVGPYDPPFTMPLMRRNEILIGLR